MITVVKDLYRMFLPGVHLNRSLRILISLSVLMNFIIGMFSPFYAVFVQRIGGTIASAGASWAVFEIVCGVLMILFLRWELQVREQELLMALGYTLRAVVFVSYIFMASVTQLIFTQVLWGIAVAIGQPAFDSVYAAHTSRDGNAIVEWGGLEGMISIAIGVAALLGGLIITAFGFTYVFSAMAAVCLMLALYVWFLPREVL